ncbi:DgyrCDS812 [Dimorphilus gyrociliatus]|uniref:DgyrCDS812 n=1 Tax=Dimorphilus gyrociliatus TaxID=2664684 RepID=A0A7I8VA98_9ANNE|nr:DgyrCDS812 [Dimorphilus gyrociliatus]
MSKVRELINSFKKKVGLEEVIILSEFRKKKLLDEFHTFYDSNKNGCIEWKDFVLARENICKMNGWKLGSEKFMYVHQVFTKLWQELNECADENTDGKVSTDEWLSFWLKDYIELKERQNIEAKKQKKKPNEIHMNIYENVPVWLEDYIQYKFNLLNRTGDGIVDGDEFEYTLGLFDIPAKDCRTAFIMLTENNSKKINFPYFRKLALQYYRSDDETDVGNFINGRLTFSDELDK